MIYRLLTILFKRKKAALTVFFTVISATAIYLLTVTPSYESNASLIVRFNDQSLPELDRGPARVITPSDRHEIVLANSAIIGSRDLARQTIDSIGMETIYPELVEEPPEFGMPVDEAVRRFVEATSVNVGPQDNIIYISFLHRNPEMAQRVVKQLIDLYVERQSAVYRNPQTGFLDEEVKNAADRLEIAQNALQKFKNDYRISSYDEETVSLLKQRGEIEATLRSAEARLAQSEQKKADLTRLMQDVPETISESPGGERYRSLDEAESRLSELKSKQSQMKATYTANSPVLAAINAAVATTESDVRRRRSELSNRSTETPNIVYQTLQTDLLRVSSEVRSNAEPVRIMGEQLKSIDSRLGVLEKNQSQFNRLSREQNLAEETYRSLATRFEEARIKENLNEQRISPASVITQPTIPLKPSKPRRMVIILVALVGGSLLTIGTVLLLESADSRFTTAEQVVWILDLPVFASFEPRAKRTTLLLPQPGES